MPPALGSRQTRLGCVALLLAALAVAGEEQTRSGAAANVGYYNYESPHSNPIAALPDGSPADTVDVVDAASGAVVARIHVGIDPVGIAVRPDGREVWVSNRGFWTRRCAMPAAIRSSRAWCRTSAACAAAPLTTGTAPWGIPTAA